MKCEHCGYETHPGDQVCINCGENLSLLHSMMPEIDGQKRQEKKIEARKNVRFAFISIGIVVVFILSIAIALLWWLGR